MTDNTAARPAVSVCIASYNCRDHLEAAVASALGQTLSDIEVIIVDDASSDDSAAVAARLAAEDPRVRVDVLPTNSGPGGARNWGLELARGRWFAVLDSDDFYHPERLERLVAQAEAADADAIADDLVLFIDGTPASARRFLGGRRAADSSWIGAADYFNETRMFDSRANLGFLKPMISTAFLRRTGVRYDPALRIGEDDDLIVRLLHAGLKYRLAPQLTYFYRKHDASISHRIGSGHLDQMIANAAAMKTAWVGSPLPVTAALARREASFLDAKAFVGMIEALKTRNLGQGLGFAARRPAALRHFAMPVAARLRRLVPEARVVRQEPAVAIISRQRVIGRTNGSSTYLLSLAQAVRDAGLSPRLIQPSPHVFGRWPVLRLKPEVRVFDAVDLRGSFRVGDTFFSTEPGRYLSAARVAAGRILAKLKLPSAWLEGAKARYAVAAEWSDADRLFLARRAPARTQAILGDYMFQAKAFPYVLAPDAPTAIIMHDLFHARAQSLDAQRATDGVAVITEPQERAMLARADAVIAIQSIEADYVRGALPGKRVIVAPMAANPVDAAQAGQGGRVLFVGSSTHPNVVGLQWLFDHVWPQVLAACPKAELIVAGNVNRAFPIAPPGVRFLGVAPDLSPLYAEAGVVISPLIVGSGLKIKLVEALAQGKAIVATTVTLQGVEKQVADAVMVADTPEVFIAAMVALIRDDALRGKMAAAALQAARDHFGPAACYADLRAWLSEARTANEHGAANTGPAI
jgi:GT2 family glycosyltransferase/glycosyltransferase involved in cell wall biosynthesis